MQTIRRWSTPRNRSAYTYPFPLTERGIVAGCRNQRGLAWSYQNAAEVLRWFASRERDPLERAGYLGKARNALNMSRALRAAAWRS